MGVFSLSVWISTTRWWLMKQTPIARVETAGVRARLSRFMLLFTAAAFAADDSGVPITRIDVAAPQNYVVAGRSISLAATSHNAADAALSGRALNWQVSNPQAASIDSS